MALTIGPGITVEGGITAGDVTMPEPTGVLADREITLAPKRTK